MSRADGPHQDRARLDRRLLAGVLISVAVAGGASGMVVGNRTQGAPLVGAGVGVVASVALMLALRPVSIRLVALVVTTVSGALLVRFGSLDGSLLSGDQGALAWVVATVATFVLCDRIGTAAQLPLLAPDEPVAAPHRPADPDGRHLLRLLPLLALAVVAVAVVITPLALPHMSDRSSAGEGPRFSESAEGGAVLRSSDRLDTTTRPDNSDEVVLSIQADFGTFWRGETFDVWDGRSWTRSADARMPVFGEVVPAADDPGAAGPVVNEQRIEVEATYADIVFAAASAVEVDAGPRQLAQRPDGTLLTSGAAMGRGAAYTVTSRRAVVDEARLRAAEGEIPADVLGRYAEAPTTTDRVREAATRVTAGADTTYDKIRALERWMGRRVEYSLDAPLPPTDVDVVDHFLFEAEQGWCQQVASSLVVMARANGIPARLVTGFVPGTRDRVTGAYQVRAVDYHAWAEVWFPEVGWVAFDPTADVPLAGADRAEPTVAEWLADHAVVLFLGLAALVAVGGPLVVLVRRWSARRATAPTTWAGGADARLASVGEALWRPRGPGETATAYAADLAEHLDRSDLAAVGRAVDDALFAPRPPSGDAMASADAALADAEATVPTGRAARRVAGAAAGGPTPG